MRHLDRVAFVLCGCEHSGTTCTSQLLKQKMEGVTAGFEIGVMLNPTPRDFMTSRFKVFANKMLEARPKPGKHGRGWGLKREDLAACCDTDSFPEFYRRLSDTWADGQMLFDKTPSYIYLLKDVMQRSQNGPVLVTYKPAHYQYAAFKRRGVSPERCMKIYEHWKRSLREVAKDPDMVSRIRLIEHFDFIKDREAVTDKAIEFVNSFGQTFETTRKPETHPSVAKDFTRNYDIEDYITPQEKKALDKVTIDIRDMFESITI